MLPGRGQPPGVLRGRIRGQAEDRSRREEVEYGPRHQVTGQVNSPAVLLVDCHANCVVIREHIADQWNAVR